MATRKKTAAPNFDVEDEVEYHVTLNKPYQVGRLWLRPGNGPVTVKGRIIKEMPDGIAADVQAVTSQPG